MELERCRMCLSQNIRMHNVLNTDLQHIYEKITDQSYIKEARPLRACYICYSQLKNCHQFMRKCIKSEEILSQMLRGNQEQSGFIDEELSNINTLVVSTMHHISISGYEAVGQELDSSQVEPIIKMENEETSEPEPIEPTSYLNLLWSEPHPDHEEKSPDTGADVKWEVPVSESYMELPIEFERNEGSRPDTISSNVQEDCLNNSNTASQTGTTSNVIGTHELLKENLQNKIPFESELKSYTCVKCNKIFSEQSELIEHKRLHFSEKSYKCEYCHKIFRQKGNLTGHIRIHTGEKPFKCDQCDSSFTHKSGLLTHSRLHTGEKPFECNVCHRSFTVKSALKGHIRIHTGEKPYKCEVCQTTFNQRGHLNSHAKIHSGERPYQCHICPSRFRDLSSFKKHIHTHTAERLFQCTICERRFIRKDHLKSHYRTHNKVTEQ